MAVERAVASSMVTADKKAQSAGNDAPEGKSKLLSHVLLHFTVFLWGFTAILGKLITEDSLHLVWHRAGIAFLCFSLVPGNLSQIRKVDLSTILIFYCVGLAVTTHWLMMYASIKFGDSASISLACLGTMSFFSALLEPLVMQTAFSIKDVLSGIVVVVGVSFIYRSLPTPPPTANYHAAVLTGLASDFFFGVYTVFNKKYHALAPPLAAATIELFAAFSSLTLLVPAVFGSSTEWVSDFDYERLNIENIGKGPWDFILIAIMAVFCTNITLYLSIIVCKDLSAFSISLAGNMEPVYGIVLGALIFHENTSLNKEFYVGAAVTLCAVFADPIVSYLQSYAKERPFAKPFKH